MKFCICLTRNIPIYKCRKKGKRTISSKINVEVDADNRVQAGFIAKQQMGRGWRLVPYKTADTD
jgi:hypothetical protein